MKPGLRLPDMEIISATADYCNGSYPHGEWSCLRGVFELQRQQMHHILQNYVPTTLIVIISWFSFWLDVESVPGRVSLCITTLLTLATQASSARLALPQVSYVKAIDVWLEACLGFVFGVLIEFTIVNYLARVGMDFGGGARKRRGAGTSGMATAEILMAAGGRKTLGTAAALTGRKASFRRPITVNMNGATDENLEQHNRSQDRRSGGAGFSYNTVGFRNHKSKKYLAHQIDKACRAAFPLAFCLFLIFYWTYYLVIT